MSRVDAHLHFWHLGRGDYDWLTPELSALYRDFGPDDVSAALDAADVDSVVVVQAAATEAETCYLFELARDTPRIAGVVGWVDLAAPDAPARIGALVRAGGGLLKGLRPMVQDIADVQWLASPALDAAFDALIAHDLAFDALIRAAHVPALQARLQRHRSVIPAYAWSSTMAANRRLPPANSLPGPPASRRWRSIPACTANSPACSPKRRAAPPRKRSSPMWRICSHASARNVCCGVATGRC